MHAVEFLFYSYIQAVISFPLISIQYENKLGDS